jgi:hypothetical protein
MPRRRVTPVPVALSTRFDRRVVRRESLIDNPHRIIERKGDDGVGQGNFRALFVSMERDQIRRGVLKVPSDKRTTPLANEDQLSD